MVVRMGGLKKAKKIEAALFSLWCHPRRRCLKNRRRWFQVCAEWKIRLSLSLPPPWKEDARIDDDGSERWLACSSSRPICFPIPKKEYFSEREPQKSMTMAMAMKKKENFSTQRADSLEARREGKKRKEKEQRRKRSKRRNREARKEKGSVTFFH